MADTFARVTRIDPDIHGDEHTLLSQFLDFHRATLVKKVDGLSAEQLRTRAMPSSAITLAGMLKHLALVEDDWFQSALFGRTDIEPWASAPFDDDRDWDWHSAIEDSPRVPPSPVRRRLRPQPGGVCRGRGRPRANVRRT